VLKPILIDVVVTLAVIALLSGSAVVGWACADRGVPATHTFSIEFTLAAQLRT
jgi:hypothetical protein